PDSISGLPGGSGESFKELFINNARIVDSLAHMTASLDSLFGKLTHEQRMFTNISRKEKLDSLDLSEGEREELEGLLKGKTSYPYEAASWGLMDAHPSQVTKAMFYSELTDSHISDKDYLAYLRLCELMRWETFAEAHDFYLYNDVLMLTD